MGKKRKLMNMPYLYMNRETVMIYDPDRMFVRGCVSTKDGSISRCEDVGIDEDDAHFYTVYGMDPTGEVGSQALYDAVHEYEAMEWMLEMRKRIKWPRHVFVIQHTHTIVSKKTDKDMDMVSYFKQRHMIFGGAMDSYTRLLDAKVYPTKADAKTVLMTMGCKSTKRKKYKIIHFIKQDDGTLKKASS